MLVIVLLLVIIIVAAGVLVYLAMGPSSSGNPTATPGPSGTGATPTPTGASPTATPSGSGQMADFRAGVWATYLVKTYDETGTVDSESTMKYAIDDGSYNGAACWLFTMEMQMDEDSVGIKTVSTYWTDKSTLEAVHMKTQIYTNGEVTYEYEEDIEPGDTSEMPDPVDMDTFTTYETITVPAGTFYCGKISITTASGEATTWATSDVPILGFVKMETTSNGIPTTTTELTAYGS